MMTREELEAALVNAVIFDSRDNVAHEIGRAQATSRTIRDAVRKQLALMPEKCGTCGGEGSPIVGYPCKDCHGSGKVYPPETVEKIETAIWNTDPPVRQITIAVLDALGEA